MPGIKRKGGPAYKGNGVGQNSKKKLQEEVAVELDEESNSGDFDDGEDLMAAAVDEVLDGEGEDGGSSDEGSIDEDERDGEVHMLSDEDMEGGFEDVAEVEEVQAGPSRSHTRPSLYAIPSRDEMSALKNTSELYKSNIFKLKAEEMVSEILPKYGKSGPLDAVLRQIKSIVESMPALEALPLELAEEGLRKRYSADIGPLPYHEPRPKEDSLLKFAFEKPSRVQMVGSWILKTAALRPQGVDVDMVLTMPSSIFQEKDYMNMRYFHKRTFYLAAVAAALESEKELGITCHYAVTEEDALRPYLVLQSSLKAGLSKLKASIRIHLGHQEGLFAARRLCPSRDNVRIDNATDSEQPATPAYNAAVLADSLYASHLIYLNATSQMSEAFAEACVLLKTWSFQRSLGSGLSKGEIKGRTMSEMGRRVAVGTNSIRFILSMLLAHLLHGPEKTTTDSSTKTRLSPSFSSYQLFRGTIDFLASHDFSTHPLIMRGVGGLLSNRDKIPVDEFSQHAKAVIVDPTGSINLLQNVPTGSLRFLQSEARATMALLNDTDQDHFDQVFLQDRSRPSFAFDQVIKVNLGRTKQEAGKMAMPGSSVMKNISEVSATLARALNTRAVLITFFGSHTCRHWPLQSKRTKPSHLFEIGIMYDPQHAFRLVDHGPRPEDQAASEAFKHFWGEMAELRRFRDGRIVESVVWPSSGPLDRSSIPQLIIKHTLQRHHGILSDQIVFHSEAFQGLLLPNERLARETYLTMPSEAGFQTAQRAFDEVVKALRGLEGLPLSLISVVAADPGLRSMSVMVPSPVNLNTSLPGSASYLPAHDFVITLESSGKWPDDLVAIQAMKMAFYEAMASKLAAALPHCKTAVVLDVDADVNKYMDSSALEIVLSSGLAFRGRIHHERERLLLHRILDDKKESQKLKSDAKAALERFETRFEHNERHHNHMAALSHRFSSLSEAVRLLKRWISSQMMGMDVPEQLCELVVAQVYIKAGEGGTVPSMGHAGFVQTLQRLSVWNWRQEPLTVAMVGATSSSPVGTLDADATKKVEAAFEHTRKSDPGLNHYAWFIATESELNGVLWARNHPNAATADALQRLARGASVALSAGPYLSAESIKSLFVPSASHFDFLIHLEPAVVNRYLDHVAFDENVLQHSIDRITNGKEESKSKYRNFNLQSASSVQAGLDVGREYVLLLESLYLDTMRLYYDSVGGIVIGGLFNPSLSKPRPFRVGLGFNSRPVDDSSKEVILNHEDVVAEIERLGRGIVERVEWRRR